VSELAECVDELVVGGGVLVVCDMYECALTGSQCDWLSTYTSVGINNYYAVALTVDYCRVRSSRTIPLDSEYIFWLYWYPRSQGFKVYTLVVTCRMRFTVTWYTGKWLLCRSKL
jgi:hypothetical protein